MNSPEAVRTGLTVDEIKRAFRDNLCCGLGRIERYATKHDLYVALALTVRDRLFQRAVESMQTYGGADARRAAYLSAEYLPAPHLANNLLNLGITEVTREALRELGYDLNEILAQEEEPGLGNGGLGRLASCYMDSLASVEVPALGYGIRYEFGIFDQIIRDGWQCEITDKWLRNGNPWEIARPDITYAVKFGGLTEGFTDENGRFRIRWIPETEVKGAAYDTPILGYQVNTRNILRLWKAEAIESFDFAAFNHGDYYRAVQDKLVSENITKVLYPNDEVDVGKELRLKQQFFFVSCSLQDMLRIHALLGGKPATFHEKWAVQLNDTHPAIAVAELMRLLVDEHGLGWDEAWLVTRATFAYTNHTLLPEALEKWTVELFGSLLPRHLEIVYEINRRFLDEVREEFPADDARLARLSLIDVLVKRIDEYKRQHLAALHIITLYLRLRRHPQADVPARTFFFGGKAAPGYFLAKRIIKLINAVGEIVNTDPIVRDRLKVVFFPDFNVKNAHFVYPAANLSEQISTAGKEASGTGNMKFALNGALTIGTLDGANVEIREEVGAENFFLFGLNAAEVTEVKTRGYRPRDYYDQNRALREVIDFIDSGALGGSDRELFRPIVENLLNDDPFLLLADYQGYIEAQERVHALWRDVQAWTRSSVLNTARMGKFSSDRSIRDYCERVWNIKPGSC